MSTESIQRFTIIIGAAKCGTSSLFQYLSEHPQICPSRVKEPNFFASEEAFARGRAWYESQWNFDPNQHHTALEASTTYSVYPVYPSAARNMASFAPAEFKLIYILRDPLEQIASNYVHALSMGSEWCDAQSEWWTGPRINRFFLAVASYAQQLDEYLAHFHREDILLLELAELKRDAPRVLKRICQFIGADVSYTFRGVGEIVNPSEGKVLPGSLWSSLRAVSLLRDAFRVLPIGFRSRMRQWTGRTAAGRMEFTEEEKSRVVELLREDWIRFRDVHGFDVSSWTSSF